MIHDRSSTSRRVLNPETGKFYVSFDIGNIQYYDLYNYVSYFSYKTDESKDITDVKFLKK